MLTFQETFSAFGYFFIFIPLAGCLLFFTIAIVVRKISSAMRSITARSARKKRHDGTEEFDLKAHRFGMAYYSMRFPDGFYPTCFRDSGMRQYCDVIRVGKITPGEPQFIWQLRRLPEKDMILRTDATAATLSVLKDLRALTVKHQEGFRGDNEAVMAEACEYFLDDIDDAIDRLK